jgi:hypothetical protein
MDDFLYLCVGVGLFLAALWVVRDRAASRGRAQP